MGARVGMAVRVDAGSDGMGDAWAFGQGTLTELCPTVCPPTQTRSTHAHTPCTRVAQDAVPEEHLQEDMMKDIGKGNFTMRILYEQLANIQKMGPVNQVMSMIPGLSNSGLFTQVRAGRRRYLRTCGGGSCQRSVFGSASEIMLMSGHAGDDRSPRVRIVQCCARDKRGMHRKLCLRERVQAHTAMLISPSSYPDWESPSSSSIPPNVRK